MGCTGNPFRRNRHQRLRASLDCPGPHAFPIRTFQVDSGSEFEVDFEDPCQTLQIPFFVLPPRSPKLNGHVECANRAHTEEFYELCRGAWIVAAIAPALLA